MSNVSFQYLKSAFERSYGTNELYVERNAFVPPDKPYFKGTDDIPEDHPSFMIRDVIRKELSEKDFPCTLYPGNSKNSELHEHTTLCEQFKQYINEEKNTDIMKYMDCKGDSYIRSLKTFQNDMVVIPFNDSYFVIPPQCGFFNGDIFSFIKEKHDFKYDIIEIDPPWPNKSVNRSKLYSKSYYSFDAIQSLFTQLPISSLCKENCYIVVWITNDPRCIDYVFEFFQRHGITHITTAFWTKTTSNHRPIVPLSCPTRETFERVVVGRYVNMNTYCGKRVHQSILSEKDDLLHHVYQLSGKNKGMCGVTKKHPCDCAELFLPFLISPVSFHSRKPNCIEFDFLNLPDNFHGLELFARQLRSQWYSVGNEVFLFQNGNILIKSSTT